jgi:hypothetical protein
MSLRFEHTTMNARDVLAPVAALLAVAAAIAIFLFPAADGPGADGTPESSSNVGGRVDGWANRDLDIGVFGFSAAMNARVDGGATRDNDIGGFGFAASSASLMEGWANRDLDIGTN